MGLFLILKGVYTMNKTRRKELGAAIDVLWDAEAFIEGVKEEDVLSYALFPQPSVSFFKYRQAQKYGLNSDLANFERKSYPV